MLALSVEMITKREHRLVESQPKLSGKLSDRLPRTATLIGCAYPEFCPINATKRTIMLTAGERF